jgi:hypothetical protein
MAALQQAPASGAAGADVTDTTATVAPQQQPGLHIQQPQPQQPPIRLAGRLAAALESGISSFSSTPPAAGGLLGLSGSGSGSSGQLGGDSDQAVAGTPGNTASGPRSRPQQHPGMPTAGIGAAGIVGGSSGISPHGGNHAHPVMLGSSGDTAVTPAQPSAFEAPQPSSQVVTTSEAPPDPATVDLTHVPVPAAVMSLSSETPIQHIGHTGGAGAVAALSSNGSPIPASTAGTGTHPHDDARARAAHPAFMMVSRGSSLSAEEEVELARGSSAPGSASPGTTGRPNVNAVAIVPMLAGQASFSASAVTFPGAASSSREDPTTTARSETMGYAQQQQAAQPRSIAHSLGASGVYPAAASGATGTPAGTQPQPSGRTATSSGSGTGRRPASASSGVDVPVSVWAHIEWHSHKCKVWILNSQIAGSADTSAGPPPSPGFLPPIGNTTPRGGAATVASAPVPNLSARGYSNISLGQQAGAGAVSGGGTADGTPRRSLPSSAALQQAQRASQGSTGTGSPRTPSGRRLPPLTSAPSTGSSTGRDREAQHGFAPNSARERERERERLPPVSDAPEPESDPDPAPRAGRSSADASGSHGADSEEAAADAGLPAVLGGGGGYETTGSERRRHSLPHPSFRAHGSSSSPAGTGTPSGHRNGGAGGRKGSAGAVLPAEARQQQQHQQQQQPASLFGRSLALAGLGSNATGNAASVVPEPVATTTTAGTGAGAGALLSPVRTPSTHSTHAVRPGHGQLLNASHSHAHSASVSVSGASPLGAQTSLSQVGTPHMMSSAGPAALSSASPDVIMLLQHQRDERERDLVGHSSSGGGAAGGGSGGPMQRVQPNLRLQRSTSDTTMSDSAGTSGSSSGVGTGAGAGAGFPQLGRSGPLVPLPGVMEQPELERSISMASHGDAHPHAHAHLHSNQSDRSSEEAAHAQTAPQHATSTSVASMNVAQAPGHSVIDPSGSGGAGTVAVLAQATASHKPTAPVVTVAQSSPGTGNSNSTATGPHREVRALPAALAAAGVSTATGLGGPTSSGSASASASGSGQASGDAAGVHGPVAAVGASARSTSPFKPHNRMAATTGINGSHAGPTVPAPARTGNTLAANGGGATGSGPSPARRSGTVASGGRKF